jgi:hypothetical protein
MGRTSHSPGWRWFSQKSPLQWTRRKSLQRQTQTALRRWSEGRCSKVRVKKLDSSHPKPGRMEWTLKGGRVPFWAVAPMEGEGENNLQNTNVLFLRCFQLSVIVQCSNMYDSCLWQSINLALICLSLRVRISSTVTECDCRSKATFS